MDPAPAEADPDDRTERLRLIADSAAGLLRGARAGVRRRRFGAEGFDRALWKAFAAQGWLALRLPETAGGAGMGLAELGTLARACGREVLPEPAALAALAVPALPAPARAAAAAGDRVILPAFAPFGGDPPRLRDGRLQGRCAPVPLARAADAFLVQTDAGAALVAADAPGLALDAKATHDGFHLGFPAAGGAPAEPVAADMDALREAATLVLAAELLGLADTAFDLTLAYLGDRRQFDRPIGAFQALQHRMVDLLLERALAEAAVEAAAAALDGGAAGAAARRAVSLAKARAAKAALAVTREAIQLHGAIGYTDAADIGLYLRRAMVLAGILGTEAAHRRRLLDLAGEAP